MTISPGLGTRLGLAKPRPSRAGMRESIAKMAVREAQPELWEDEHIDIVGHALRRGSWIGPGTWRSRQAASTVCAGDAEKAFVGPNERRS